MLVSGWGNFPSIAAKVSRLWGAGDVSDYTDRTPSFIAKGNLRSYGDSALWSDMLDLSKHNLMLGFDEHSGALHVQAGCLLADILQVFVPRGWFVKVTPGTRLITVAGAIASDVHGKNHHIAGCFSECVESITLLQADGDSIVCDRNNDPELFRATCGGQGLTGVILDAKITLQRINSSSLDVTTYKTSSLRETFEIFEEQAGATYSVAWIDCLATGDALGRAHVSAGEFRDDGNLIYAPKQLINMPLFLPRFVLNSITVKLFNFFYYHRIRERVSKTVARLESFFYPLDSINNWNRIYGRKGFIQYQVILPLAHSFEGMERLLSSISAAGKGSFLAVLKLHGPSNENYLSFPLEGYSLALDFKFEEDLFELLDQLDEIVVAYGGRTYLAKDSRVAKAVFESGYPKIDDFRRLRKERKMSEKFRSLQSERLGL